MDNAIKAGADLARRAFEEAARRAAAEAARLAAQAAARQAAEAARQQEAARAQGFKLKDGFERVTKRGPDLTGMGSAPPPVPRGPAFAASGFAPALFSSGQQEAPVGGTGNAQLPQGGGMAQSLSGAIDAGLALLRGGPVNQDADWGRRIITNPPDVHSTADTDPTSARYQSAQTVLQANSSYESQALSQLSPEDQARYQAVKTALANDPVAQLALQTMLLQGRLPGDAALGGDQGNVLRQLETLATQDLHADLESQRGNLLAQVVKEIAVPEAINQAARGTCGATSCAIALARLNPAEYVRVIGGLASPSGSVTLADGATQISAEPGSLVDDGSGRSISQRLIEPALMELGNGWRDYDNATDQHSGGFLPNTGGLLTADIERIMEPLLGLQMTSSQLLHQMLGAGWSYANTAIDAVNNGQAPVIVQLDFPPSGSHFVVMDRVVEEDGKKYVYYTNPWGQTERMDYDSFSNVIRGVTRPE